MEKETGVQKIVSFAIVLMMILSTLAISANITDARPPENIPSGIDESGEPILKVTELRATTSVVYLDQENRLVLSIANQGNATALKVTANITDIVPKVSEETITTLNFGTLRPGMEKTRFIDWTPTVRGVHYIRVEMRCEYLTRNSPAEMVESEPTILSAGFPVTPQGTIIRWGPGGWPAYHDNNTVNSTNDFPDGIREVTGTSSDHITIEVYEGLSIENTSTLILNEHVTLVMVNPNEPGEFGIDIREGGTFRINSPSRSTTIQSSSSAWEYTYPFLNSGTVDFLGATVWHTHGPSDLSLAGGIQNLGGSVCILDNCNLLEADTHSLYINGAANVQVMGAGTIIGRDDANPNPDVTRGHGIFVNNANPTIEDITVQYQKLDGIRIENATTGGTVLVPILNEYASSTYDCQLTSTLENSVKPIVVSGNGASYLVFQKVETGEILFRKTIDGGISWSTDGVIGYSAVLRNMDFAADGENLALVWEDMQDTMKLQVIYSSDGGDTWTSPTEISLGYWPSIAVEGSNVYLAYRFIKFTGFPDFIMGVRLKWNGNGMLDLEETFENPLGGEFAGIPKVAVSNGTIHVVVADLTLPNANINYWQSSDNGGNWSESQVLATWNYHGSPTSDFQYYFSLSAKGDIIHLLWSNYIDGYYQIFKKSSLDNGVSWLGSTQITSPAGDSLFPCDSIEASDHHTIVYWNNMGGIGRIYLQRFDDMGNLVVPETCMTPGSPGASMSSVSTDTSGRAYLTWADERTGNFEVFIKTGRSMINRVWVADSRRNGIVLQNSDTLVIDTSIINNEVDGLTISTGSTPVILANNISWNGRHGICIENSAPSIKDNNTIRFNRMYGIYVDNVWNENAIICNNTIEDNFGSGIYAINTNLTISGNLIASNGLDPIFEDGFEIDTGSWTADGLWHRVNSTSPTAKLWHLSHGGDWSYWYGQDLSGNYDTGTQNSGSITSPVIDITNATSAALVFWSWYETDTFSDITDKRYVAIYNGGSSKTIQLYGEKMSEWTRHVIDISEFAGSKITVYFDFNTMDGLDNAHQGWYIDDVEIVTAYPLLEGHGIHLSANAPCRVDNNTLWSNNQFGLLAEDVQTAKIEWNDISYNGFGGIELSSSDNNTITHNNIYFNQEYGIYLTGSNNNRLSNNSIDQYSETIGGSDFSDSITASCYSDDTILLKLDLNIIDEANQIFVIEEIETKIDAKMAKWFRYAGIYTLKLNGDVDVQAALRLLSRDSRVLYAEPNYKVYSNSIPNDTFFNQLWGLNNLGQTGGTLDADIDAPDAWNITTGNRSVVVGVIDTGIDYNHPDLAPNMWINPYVNQTGYINDTHGIAPGDENNDPMDTGGHGTHIAGTIGAVGNNESGVVGVNWNVSLMALKWDYNLTAAIECIEYAIMMKLNYSVNVSALSASWNIGPGGFSQSLYDAIAMCRDAGILFVVAAGNTDPEFGNYIRYPASYNLTNIITVAATDHNDNLWSSSLFNACSVDVAAPGANIYSTLPGGSYGYKNGTSMATPHVSGLAALISSKYPSYTCNNLKNVILTSVDMKPNLSDKMVTGGRINAYSALTQDSNNIHTFVHFPANGTSISIGTPTDLMVLVTDGINPITNANIRFEFSDGNEGYLLDNGIGADQVVDDGYYSASWTPHLFGKVYVIIYISVDGYEEIVNRYVLVSGALRNHWYGIYLDSSNDNIIQNNNASDNEYGIYLISSNNNTIANNTASLNFNMGFCIFASNYNILENNTVTSNTNYGILLSSSTNIILTYHRDISANRYGIYLTNGANATIHYNNIFGNIVCDLHNSDSSILVDATYNWWGRDSPVFGEDISSDVLYDPWLTEPYP